MKLALNSVRNGLLILLGLLIWQGALGQVYEIGGTYSNSTGTFSLNLPSGAISSYTILEYKNGSYIGNETVTGTTKTYSGKGEGAYEYAVRANHNYYGTIHLGSVLVSVGNSLLGPGAVFFSGLSHPASNLDTDGSIVVSWGAVPGNVGSYKLEQRLNSGNWVEVYSGAQTSSSRNLNEGHYQYRVRACNSTSCSGWTTSTSIQISHIPGVPGAISFTNLSHPESNADVDGNYTVNWGVASNNPTRYELYVNSFYMWESFYSGAARSVSVSVGHNVYGYKYKVRACNARGCGDYTAEKHLSVTSAPAIPGPIFGPNTDSDGSFVLYWDTPVEVLDELQRRIQNGQWVTIQSAFAEKRRSESGLADGIYEYRLRSCNVFCSGWSATKTVSVISSSPGKPTNISYINNPLNSNFASDGHIIVSWDIPSGAVAYYELYQRDPTGHEQVAYTGAANSAQLHLADGFYIYEVRACNSAGCSPRSSPNIGVQMARAYVAPNLNIVKGARYGEITASWNDPGGYFTKFEVQRRHDGGLWQATDTNKLVSHEYGLHAGGYSYRVRVCGPTCSAWSNTKNVTIEPNALSESTASMPSSLSFDRRVNRNGILSLSMPLKLLPGVNGLAPDLTLSQEASSPSIFSDIDDQIDDPSTISGGWSLQGINPISTCKLAPAYERTGKELTFCYMGQTLVPVVTGQQGIGSTFRLKKNSDVLFKFYNNNAGLPVFSLQKGGRTFIFGETENSRTKRQFTYPSETNYHLDGNADGRNKYSWYPSAIKDSFGNELTITYQKVDAIIGNKSLQEIYPVSFDYGNYRTELTYTFMTDTSTSGIALRQLRSIRNLANEIPVSVYELGYGNRGDVNVLSSVRLCGYEVNGNHKTCGQATIFDYVSIGNDLKRITPYPYNNEFGKVRYAVSEINNGLGSITRFAFEQEGVRRAREEAQGYTEYGDAPQLPPLNPNCILDNICPGGIVQIKSEEHSNGVGGFNKTEYAYPFTYGVINTTYRKKLPDGTFEYHDFNRLEAQDGLPSNKERYLNPRTLNGSNILLGKEERYWNLLKNPVPLVGQPEEIEAKIFYKSYLDQQVNYIVENGVVAGAVVTKNQPVWSNNVIASMKTTNYTGYGYQEDGYAGTVDPFTNLQHKQVANTAYSNNLTSWSIGFAASKTANYIDPQNSANNKLITTSNTRHSNQSLVVGSSTVTTSNHVVTETPAYDEHGNPVSATISGYDFASRTTQLIDFIDDRYPRYQINAEGHLSEFEYDLRFGKPKKVTDSNGLITEYEYDAFGNLVKESLPNGTDIHTTIALCDFTCPEIEDVAPTYKIIKSTTNPYESYKGAPDQVTYYDVLDREIRIETEGFTGESLKVDIAYDNLGRVKKRSAPYVSGAATYTTYQYDLYDRPLEISNADGSSVNYTYELLSDRRRVTKTTQIVGPLGGKTYTRVEEYNSLNQLIVSYDAYGTTDQVKTEYRYDAMGNNTWVRVNEDNNTIVVSTFDENGNMKQLVDPSAGTVTYQYDGLKQVVRQTDARSIVTDFTYDLLGRMTFRSDDHLGANPTLNEWHYDSQYNGALDYKSRNGFTESYSYTPFVEMKQINTSISLANYTGSFASNITYDGYGRVETQSYPSGLNIFNKYNAFGFASATHRNSASGPLVYRIDAMDNHGNISDTRWGNEITSQKMVNPITGQIEKIVTDGGAVQNLELTWWSDGTVYSRERLGGNNRREVFNYDNLKRLRGSNINGGSRTLGFTYDPLGNIKTKTDSTGQNLTGYRYDLDTHALRLNRVIVNGTQHDFVYDLSGNIVKDNVAGTANDRDISYNAFGKPYLITKGSQSAPTAKAFFEYDPDTTRFYQENHRGDKTVYLYGGNVEIIIPATGNLAKIEKTYLSGAIHSREVTITGGVSETMLYTHTDHLGSITVITNQNGDIDHGKAFDPFGGYRDLTWASISGAPSWLKQAQTTSRGFTGHEQLDDVGLIHMNGRVYDPLLGRFISPDVIVQAPNFSQSYNRYSYVWNNPVSMIDPTGFVVNGGSSICDDGSSYCSGGAESSQGSAKEAEKKEAQGKVKSAELSKDGKWVQGSDAQGNKTIAFRYQKALGSDNQSVDVAGGGQENGGVGVDAQKGDWTEKWFGKGNHKYGHLSPSVCSASESCTHQNVVNSLNTKGVHPNQTQPFVPGKEYIGDVDIPGPFGVDHVKSTAIYSTDGVQIGVRNETLENHALHPGVVERSVIQNGSSFHIYTQGGGYGRWGGPNIWFDNVVWDAVDQRVMSDFYGVQLSVLCVALVKLTGASWIEHLVQIIFLSAGCSVNYFGLTLSVLLIGFLPIYFFAYFFYKRNLTLTDRKTLLFLLLSCLAMLIFSSILWLSSAILGQWG